MLRVSVLGEQAIVDDETGIRTRSARAVALVAFLAWHAGSAQPRQRIAGLFWPESTDAQALTNLRRELHHLRQVLGDDCSPVVTPTDLRWRDSETCRVNLRAFGIERDAALAAAEAGDDEGVVAHATRGIAEYRGDLLPGAYEDWLVEARSQLERQCVDLCDLACEAQVRRGDLAGAAAAARRRIELQPLEEVGYRTLMRLQADLGDRAGAVSTYHHCASVLERELGIVPDPQTRQVFESLIADSGPPGTRRPVTGTAVGRSGRPAARLVGRSQELRRLRELWQAAAAGHPALVLVRGGAGVGKTRLVAELAELARRQGAVVASSQCFGTPGRLALAPVADWMRHPVVQGATAALDQSWRAEVGRLVPSGDHEPSAVGPRAIGVGPRAIAVGPRAAGNRPASGGRGLAAAPVLRGPGPGAAGRGRPDAAGPGRHPMVRSGDAGLHPALPGTRPGGPAPGGRDLARRRSRAGPGGRRVDRQNAGYGSAHRALPPPVRGGRNGPAGRGHLRPAPPRRRYRPAPGHHGRLPAVRHRGRARHRRFRGHR